MPIPSELLDLGPDNQATVAWLLAHWGVLQALRKVAWPLFMKPAATTTGIARFRSASLRMICGPLPPSSSVTRFRVSAADRRIDLPAAVEPVKVTLATSGWLANSAPTTSPRPVTMLNRPAGAPAAWSASVTIWVWMALISLGLITTVQPAAMAVAILLQMKLTLLFQGGEGGHHAQRRHADLGPTDRAVEVIGLQSLGCLEEGAGVPPRHRFDAARRRAVIFDNRSDLIVEPRLHRVVELPQHSDALGLGGPRDQTGSARLAAAMAARASSISPSRTVPMTASVDGLNNLNRSVPCGVTKAQIHTAIEDMDQHRDRPSGTLRLNIALGAALMILKPLILEYLRRYKVELVSDSWLIDLVEEGFDAGFRLREVLRADMVAVPFSRSIRSIVVGSPGYFEGRERPKVPSELMQHACIRMRMASGSVYHWELEKRGEAVAIDVPGVLTLDETSLMHEGALAGMGLVLITEQMVAADLAAGRLIQVLDDWTLPIPASASTIPGGGTLQPNCAPYRFGSRTGDVMAALKSQIACEPQMSRLCPSLSSTLARLGLLYQIAYFRADLLPPGQIESGHPSGGLDAVTSPKCDFVLLVLISDACVAH